MKTFTAFVLTLVLTPSALAQNNELYVDSTRASIARLAMFNDDCVSITPHKNCDLLCLFDEQGVQYNLSGYNGFDENGNPEISFCNNSALLYNEEKKSLTFGGHKIKEYAYRVCWKPR